VSNNKKKVSLVIKQDYKKNMFCFISYQADRKKNTGTVTAVQIISKVGGLLPQPNVYLDYANP